MLENENTIIKEKNKWDLEASVEGGATSQIWWSKVGVMEERFE